MSRGLHILSSATAPLHAVYCTFSSLVFAPRFIYTLMALTSGYAATQGLHHLTICNAHWRKLPCPAAVATLDKSFLYTAPAPILRYSCTFLKRIEGTSCILTGPLPSGFQIVCVHSAKHNLSKQSRCYRQKLSTQRGRPSPPVCPTCSSLLSGNFPETRCTALATPHTMQQCNRASAQLLLQSTQKTPFSCYGSTPSFQTPITHTTSVYTTAVAFHSTWECLEREAGTWQHYALPAPRTCLLQSLRLSSLPLPAPMLRNRERAV
jgi:hypothetical protein